MDPTAPPAYHGSMSALRRLALPCCLLLSVGCVAAKQESAAREQDAPPAAERAEDKTVDAEAPGAGGSPGAKPNTVAPLAEDEEAKMEEEPLADDADGDSVTGKRKAKQSRAAVPAGPSGFAEGERDRGDLLSEVRLVGDPVVGGGLDRDIVRRRTKVQVKDVAVCHDLELRRSPGLSGTIVVRLTLDEDGAVEDAELVDEDSDIGSPATERCVLEAVKRWTFPAPEDGSATVEISLELAPK